MNQPSEAEPERFQVEVDPKFWFTNERTYLHWIKIILTLGTLGLGLAASDGSSIDLPNQIGTAICAMMIPASVFYFYLYLQRIAAIPESFEEGMRLVRSCFDSEHPDRDDEKDPQKQAPYDLEKTAKYYRGTAHVTLLVSLFLASMLTTLAVHIHMRYGLLYPASAELYEDGGVQDLY